MLPVPFVAEAALSLVKGPIEKILTGYISDLELRRKLASELQGQVIVAMTKAAEQGASVILAETGSEHWLTRSWRPLLMMTLIGFLVLAGFVLPAAELLAGTPIRFEPHWSMLPPDFWTFLGIGMGGYIGGRSLEKVAGTVFPTETPRKSGLWSKRRWAVRRPAS